jgi:hypothetical protein
VSLSAKSATPASLMNSLPAPFIASNLSGLARARVTRIG